MKKAVSFIFAAVLGVTLAGCATTIAEPGVLTGSRADGTVTLFYKYWNSPGSHPPSEDTMMQLAREKCENWGYTKAEAFGTQRETCVIGSSFSCSQFAVELVYQCIN